jgi:periplasmic divalent cation tolerance protein
MYESTILPKGHAYETSKAHSMRPGTQICEVIVTAGDAEWLASMTRTLVEERLCACGHNLSPIRSIYRWEGSIHDETESRVAIHTRAELVTRIVQRVGELHPYEVPCVIALPVLDGNPAYIEWVEEQTVFP